MTVGQMNSHLAAPSEPRADGDRSACWLDAVRPSEIRARSALALDAKAGDVRG